MPFLPENIFLRIISGELPSDKVYETEDVLAFRDIAPKAKTHVLIIPKKEIITIDDTDDTLLLGQLFRAATEIAKKERLKGYKLHMNVGEEGGQVVPHIHLHLLSNDYESPL